MNRKIAYFVYFVNIFSQKKVSFLKRPFRDCFCAYITLTMCIEAADITNVVKTATLPLQKRVTRAL